MDLAEKTQFFTIDVITDLATGAPFGDLTSDADQHEYLRTATEAQPAFVMISSIPALTKIIQIPFIGKWLFPTSQDKIGMGKMMGCATAPSLCDTLQILTLDQNCGRESVRAFQS